MDECGVEQRIVNITMRVGDEALEVMDRFSRAWLPDRFFATIRVDGLDRSAEARFFLQRAGRAPSKSLVAKGACGIKALEGSWPKPFVTHMAN